MEMKTMGRFIQSLRKANGYTQQELADMLGVSNKTISSWETDNSTPDLSMIPIIAELFHVSCDELLRGEKIKEEVIVNNKSEKVKKQIVKSLIVKYTNSNYISFGILLGALLLVLLSLIINDEVVSILFFALAVIGYLFGVIYSIIVYNNYLAKADNGEDNHYFYMTLNKKFLTLECCYCPILIPIFCYLSNKRLINDSKYGITENENNSINKNFKLKRKISVIIIPIMLVFYILGIVVKCIDDVHFVSQRYEINELLLKVSKYEVKVKENTFNISHVNDDVINLKSNCTCMYNSTPNIENGVYTIQPFVGKYEELLTKEDFTDGYFTYDFSKDKKVCEIVVSNLSCLELELFETNKGTCFYAHKSFKGIYEYDDGACPIPYLEPVNKTIILDIITAVIVIIPCVGVIIYLIKRNKVFKKEVF